jgi:hypothetical protein
MVIREDKCNYDEEYVFQREWKGTERGCEMLGTGFGNEPEILDYETW